MKSDFELTDEMEGFDLADWEALTETQEELGDDWTEDDYIDRIAEKGFDPFTGKPLADLQAYKEQRRLNRIRELVKGRERTKRLLDITAAPMDDDETPDSAALRYDCHEEFLQDLANENAEIAALNLSPEEFTKIKEWAILEMQREQEQLEADTKVRLAEAEANMPEKKPCIRLVFADDPAEIATLEQEVEETQAERINEYIECTCWGDAPAVAPFCGNKGTPDQRRTALREAMRADGIDL